jgi:hypothetical protein
MHHHHEGVAADSCERRDVADETEIGLVVGWPGGATAGDDRKMSNEPFEREPMNNEPLEREPIDRVRARLEALLKANAAPRCGARSKRTGKPCRGAAMPNGRCKLHGGKSTGPRTPGGGQRGAWRSAHSAAWNGGEQR